MRITNAMLTSRALSDLQGNYAAMAKAQEQVSSAKRLNRPSDGPADVQAAIKLNESVAALGQHIRNIDAADRNTSTAETALASAGDAIQRLKELGLQAANGTLSATDRAAILKEVISLSDELVALANTKVGEDYVFSGQKTATAPYAGAAAVYAGDHGSIIARVAPGVTLAVNVTADAAFGPALAAATQLASDLALGNPPLPATLTALDAGLSGLRRRRCRSARAPQRPCRRHGSRRRGRRACPGCSTPAPRSVPWPTGSRTPAPSSRRVRMRRPRCCPTSRTPTWPP